MHYQLPTTFSKIDLSDPKITSGSSENTMLPPDQEERLGTDDKALKKMNRFLILNSPI